MADTVASLGFQIESAGLDQAKQKLGEVTTSAKSTEDQAKKTGDAISNIGKGGAGGLSSSAAGLKDLDAAAKVAGTSVGVLDSMAKRSGVSIADMAARVATARTGLSTAATASNELGTALNVIAPAARNAAVSVTTKSTAMRELNQALRTASPLLNEFDSGLGHILSSSTRVRGSLGVLAAVVGGELLFAMSKVADETLRGQKMFEAITGSAKSGNAVFSAVKETARASGLEYGTLASAVDKAAQGVSKFADRNIIYANSADASEKVNKRLTEGFGTLGKILQTAGATAKEDAEILGTVGQSIQKTGTLTADAFQKIRDTSEPAAAAIAKAFGYDLEPFHRQLEKTPIKYEELLQVLKLVQPSVENAYNTQPIVTFNQFLEKTQTEWKNLVEEFGKAGGFDVAKTAIETLSSVIKQDIEDIKGIGAAIGYVTDKASALLDVLGQLNPANWGTKLNQLGNDVANADIKGMSSSGNSIGGSSAFDSGIQLQDAGAFASGGSFVVGGSGSTDSQTVTFNATPGEIVTVSTPDQAASSIASLTAVSGSTDLEDLLKDQTKQIVDAINGLKTTNKTTTTPVTTTGSTTGTSSSTTSTSSSSTSSASSGSSGGGGSTTPFKKLEDELKKEENAYLARERELGGTGAARSSFYDLTGNIQGRGVPIKGFGGASSFPARAPIGQFAGADGNPVQMNPNSMQSQDAPDAIAGTKSQDFGWIGTQEKYREVLDDSLKQLKTDFASQKSFNETIASQNGGLQTLGRGQVSSSYPPGVLGRYDNNMNFIPNTPNNNSGFFPNNNDYVFGGQKNPFPYQPGISTPLSFPSYNDSLMKALKPMGGFDESGFKDAFGKPITGVEKNTNETNSNLDKLDRSTDRTTREVEGGAKDTVDAVDKSASTISDAITAAFNAVGDAMKESSTSSSSGSSAKESGGSSSGGGGGSGSSSFDSSGSSGYGSSGGGSGGGGGYGSSSSDYNFGGYGSPGFETNTDYSPPLDYSQMGSSSFDESGFTGGGGVNTVTGGGFEEGFATGGRFTVGGNGGNDTTPVSFRATKGEIVNITRPGMSGIKVPSSMLRPGSGAGPQSHTVNHVTNKKVTINVQAGVSADTIMRSRAQIARAM